MAGYSEGQSTNRPPLFDGTDYTFWKHRMRIFIRSQDIDVWRVIEVGNFIPKKRVDGQMIPKEYDELTFEDKKQLSMNDKALSILICGITRDVFNSVSHCETAQDMWKLLEVTHEGTSKVRKAKMNILTSEYERFKLKEKETLSEMYTRFSQLVNKMRALGKKFDIEDLNNKLLNVVQWRYRAEVASIKESKDLEVITLEEVIGSLMTYEMEATREMEDRKEKRSLAMKAESTDYDSDASVGSSIGSDGDDQELAMLAKRFKHLLNRRKQRSRRSNASSSRASSQRSRTSKSNNEDAESSKKKEVTCYRCGKTGHMRHECRVKLPQEKSKLIGKGKNRVMMTFDYSDEEADGLHEEEANIVHEPEDLCLMAKETSTLNDTMFESANVDELSGEEDDNVSNTSDSNINTELLRYVDALETKCKLLASKNKKLKTDLKTISEQLSTCSECEINKQKLDQVMDELDQLKNASCSNCKNYEHRLTDLGEINLTLERKVEELGRTNKNLAKEPAKETERNTSKTRRPKPKKVNKKNEKTDLRLRGSKVAKPSDSESKDSRTSTTKTTRKSTHAWMYDKSSEPRHNMYHNTRYPRHDYWYRPDRSIPDQVYTRPRPWYYTFYDAPFGHHIQAPFPYNPYRYHSWDYDPYYIDEPKRCYHCGKKGHLIADCRIRLRGANGYGKGNSNMSGPRKWVPKPIIDRSREMEEVDLTTGEEKLIVTRKD